MTAPRGSTIPPSTKMEGLMSVEENKILGGDIDNKKILSEEEKDGNKLLSCENDLLKMFHYLEKRTTQEFMRELDSGICFFEYCHCFFS